MMLVEMTEPILRPWRSSDVGALVESYRSSPDLATQFGDAQPNSLATAHELIDQALGFDERAKNWAVVLDDVAVGNVGVSAIEWRHETAWVHYWLARSARGQGYATRALTTVAQWAFQEGLFRLELGHRTNNPASCGVASRVGFKAEGIERQKLQYGLDRFDVELHARLATDPQPALHRLPMRQ